MNNKEPRTNKLSVEHKVYAMKNNPFTVIFGVEPKSAIPRNEEYHRVIEQFEEPDPSTYGYVITGVRGCGKTVLMTSIQNYFSDKSNWYVVRLNPDLDFFASAVSQLSEYIHLKEELVTGVNISIAGFGGGASVRSISDNETLFRKMLREAGKHKKRVLVAIDEASNTKSIKTFAHSFQAMIGEKLPVFLLMTALPENFSALSSSKNGTFLRRLPRIKLEGLNPLLVEKKYSEIFSVSRETAVLFTKTVRGYSYAFQLLGSILWDMGKKDIDDEVVTEFDAMLYDGSYKAIWDHLTEKEKSVVLAIAHSDTMLIKDIREKAGMESNQFAPYRESLKESGLVNTETYGKISFTLPRFKEFVIRMEEYLE